MAVTSTVIGAVAAVGGTVASMDAQRRQGRAADRAADEQEKIQREQEAQNAKAAADERRSQMREERVRRARVMQASANTGVAGSSGEIGALGALATNLNTNIGANLGMLQSAQNISGYSQNAANFMGQANQAGANASLWNQVSGIGSSIFQAGGGFNTLQGIGGSQGSSQQSLNQWGMPDIKL